MPGEVGDHRRLRAALPWRRLPGQLREAGVQGFEHADADVDVHVDGVRGRRDPWRRSPVGALFQTPRHFCTLADGDLVAAAWGLVPGATGGCRAPAPPLTHP